MEKKKILFQKLKKDYNVGNFYSLYTGINKPIKLCDLKEKKRFPYLVRYI